jgi:hypothetical protein
VVNPISVTFLMVLVHPLFWDLVHRRFLERSILEEHKFGDKKGSRIIYVDLRAVSTERYAKRECRKVRRYAKRECGKLKMINSKSLFSNHCASV